MKDNEKKPSQPQAAKSIDINSKLFKEFSSLTDREISNALSNTSKNDYINTLKNRIINSTTHANNAGESLSKSTSKLIEELVSTIERKEIELKEIEGKIKENLINSQEERKLIESEFRVEMEEKERNFRNKEQSLLSRQKDMERTFSAQLEQYEEVRRNIQDELIKKEGQLLKKESELQKLLVDAEREKERYQEESRKALESKSKKFVQDALETLTDKEDALKKKGNIWSICGALSIFFGIAFSITVMLTSADNFHNTSSDNLTYYLYMLFRGVIVIGLFIALSRYCFTYSNSFMHESLKISERVHAIKYGEFYLDVSGADANWENIKEAFSNWNISGESAFYRATEKNNTIDDNKIVSALGKTIKEIMERSVEKK